MPCDVRPRGVLFDVDDTLVDTRAAFAAAIAAVTARFLPDLPAGRAPDVLAAWRRDGDGHFRAYTRGETDFRSQRRRRAKALQAAFGGRALDDGALEAWESCFEDAIRGAWRAHPDARAAIAEVRARGLAIGAVSNSESAYQREKLARARLADVPFLVGVDTFGAGKPDPRVFHEACRRLGTEPAETLYVGDELDVDAVGSARAGLIGVWLDRPGVRRGGAFIEDAALAREAGVAVLRSLAELPRLLDPAGGGPGL